MRCGSFPHCRAEALPGDRFCAADRARMDAITGREAKPSIQPKVPKSGYVKRQIVSRAERTNQILDALAAGPLTGPELCAAISVDDKNSTFRRIRAELLAERRIVRQGSAKSMVWSLPAASDTPG
jgi:hypothetical protein